MSEVWTIEPRDTLMMRDGRPVGEGLPMRSLPFPWPSSVAGLARTRAGSDPSGLFTLSPNEARDLLDVQVAGPWLVELRDDGPGELYLPAPADCLWHLGEGAEGMLERRRLQPGALRDGEEMNLSEGFRPLFAEDAPRRKPTIPPAFWSWTELSEWLSAPPARSDHARATFGMPALRVEQRTHVAIDPESGRAADHMLFSSEGLRFADRERRLALVFRCADPRLLPGGVHLGGERRISWLRPGPVDLLPTRPPGIHGRLLRLVLVTPAVFADGWRPSRIGGGRVVAAAVGRPHTISGWDFAARGPKPCRRLAPAGSVYWVELNPDVDADSWIDQHWMTCISDDGQDRKDGFGLCLVGRA